MHEDRTEWGGPAGASVISRPSTARPKLVGLLPPCGGRRAGRKSMSAGACLEEKMRRGEWAIEGARLREPVEAHSYGR